MKYLTNLAHTEKIMQWFNSDWSEIKRFLNRNKLDGIELMLGGRSDLGAIDKNSVLGLHLHYWPLWMDFWRGDQVALLEQFGNIKTIKRFYGGLEQESLIDYYHKEWAIAQQLEVEYVVFHVAHVTLLESYTGEFKYDDWEVLEAAIEVINQSFGSEDRGIKLLFENLWWPGLTLTNYQLAKKFIDAINYPNKGFILDIGHLMITNPQIRDEKEACDYIAATLNGLGELQKDIKGIHLNKSLSGAYLRENHQQDILEFKKIENFWEQIDYVKDHISKIDCHIPFDHLAINTIIQTINPHYLVLEFLANNLTELEKMLTMQRSVLNIS